MKTLSIPFLLLAAVFTLAGCSSTPEPAPTPEQPIEAQAHVDVQAVGTEIAAHLVAGDVVAAEDALMTVEDPDDHAALYSLLFDRAQMFAADRDYDSCIRINRFLTRVYPEDRPAQEALVYSLWLARAQTGEAHDAATVAEIEAVSARIRAAGDPIPVWVDIALTQAAIDGGDLEAARIAMNRFNARWNREPPSLRAYAAELDRYIDTHSAN